jgi:hypothetical protein
MGHEYRVFYRQASAEELKNRNPRCFVSNGEYLPHGSLRSAPLLESTQVYVPHEKNVEVRFEDGSKRTGSLVGRQVLKVDDWSCAKMGHSFTLPSIDDADALLQSSGLAPIPDKRVQVKVRRNPTSLRFKLRLSFADSDSRSRIPTPPSFSAQLHYTHHRHALYTLNDKKVKVEHARVRVIVQRVSESGVGKPATLLDENWIMSYAKSDKNETREMATTMRAVNKLLAVNTQCLPPDYLEMGLGEFVHTVADRAKRTDALRPGAKKRKKDSKVSSSKNPVVTTAAELASNLAKLMRGLKGKMDAEKADRFADVLHQIRDEIENVAKAEAESEEASEKPKKRRKTKRFGGYQEFCKVERKNFPDTTKLMDQTKILGARWSKMSDKQKAPFEAKANAAREAYLADLAMNPPPLEPEGGKKKKKKKNKKFSGYLTFCDENRGKLESGLKVPEQAKKLGEMWKALSDEKREKYTTKAAKAKATYEAERAANPDPEESEDEGEKKRKRKKTRRFGGYQEFCKATRPKLPDGLKVTEQAKLLGAKWKSLGPKDVAKYEKMAVKSREEYMASIGAAAPNLELGSPQSKNKAIVGNLGDDDTPKAKRKRRTKAEMEAARASEAKKKGGSDSDDSSDSESGAPLASLR